MEKYTASVIKLNENREQEGGYELSESFSSFKKALEFLKNDKNQPCIDCAGFRILIHTTIGGDKLYSRDYIYGQGWKNN